MASPTPLRKTFARSAGAVPTTGGASRSRVQTTPLGTFHVKYPRPDGEGRRAPINELLANRLLEQLGVSRPRLVLVRMSAQVRKSDSFFDDLTGNVGLGVERVESAADLPMDQVPDAARRTPVPDVLAMFLALTWLQDSDHTGGNWMESDNKLFPVDLASGPIDEVWRGTQPLGEQRFDYGGLRSEIDAMPHDDRSDVLARIAALTASDLRAMMKGVPRGWASTAERKTVISELLRTREGLIRDFS
jgi:hypothetical protein